MFVAQGLSPKELQQVPNYAQHMLHARAQPNMQGVKLRSHSTHQPQFALHDNIGLPSDVTPFVRFLRLKVLNLLFFGIR